MGEYLDFRWKHAYGRAVLVPYGFTWVVMLSTAHVLRSKRYHYPEIH